MRKACTNLFNKADLKMVLGCTLAGPAKLCLILYCMHRLLAFLRGMFLNDSHILLNCIIPLLERVVRRGSSNCV